MSSWHLGISLCLNYGSFPLVKGILCYTDSATPLGELTRWVRQPSPKFRILPSRDCKMSHLQLTSAQTNKTINPAHISPHWAIVTSRSGTSRPRRPVLVRSIFSTTSRPSITFPNTTCLPSRWGVGTVVTKNWEPLVLGPEFCKKGQRGEGDRLLV